MIPHALIARTTATVLAAGWVAWLALADVGTDRMDVAHAALDRELGSTAVTVFGLGTVAFIVAFVACAAFRCEKALRYFLTVWWWWCGLTLWFGGLALAAGVALALAVGTTIAWWAES